MGTIKEKVFLLSATPYRDSDLVVNFLSVFHGKLSAVIYGGKKIGKKSSFSYHAGDYLEIEIRTQESKDFVQIINTAGLLLLDLEKFPYNRFLFHSYLLELVGRIAQPGNPAEELHEILLINNQLDWIPKESSRFIGWALWQIIKHGGYGIDFHSCAECSRETWQTGKQLEPIFRKESYQLLENSGNLVCGKCRPFDEKDGTLSSAMIKILWLFDSAPDFLQIAPKFPKEIIDPLVLFLNRYLLRCFEIRPKSLSMFLSSLK